MKTTEQFIERMEEINSSSNVFESYGKPKDQYFQELEDSLPLESWKKMLKLISGEKEIVRRIIGGKGEEYDLSTRPIYFNKSLMSIHIMDSKGLIPVLKKLLLEN